MFKPLKVFIVLLLIGRTAIAEQEGFSLPGPENFTHTATISLLNEKAVIARAGLPQWVYAASLHDLADVRVFNAEGLEVGFRLLPLLNQGKSQEFAVNALPLPPDANAESLNRAANVKVDISGKVDIHLDESPIQDSSTSSKITQWVVDDPKVNGVSIDHFRFNIADAGKSDYSADIDIESSEDLRTWQPIALHQKILVYGQQRLAQLGVTFTPTKARYWRIRSQDHDISRIAQILTQAPAKAEPVQQNQTVQCQISVNQEKLLCPLAGRVPVSGIRFDFGKQHVAFTGKIEVFDSLPNPDGEVKSLTPKLTTFAVLTNVNPDVLPLNAPPIAALIVSAEHGGKLALKKTTVIECFLACATTRIHGKWQRPLHLGGWYGKIDDWRQIFLCYSG